MRGDTHTHTHTQTDLLVDKGVGGKVLEAVCLVARVNGQLILVGARIELGHLQAGARDKVHPQAVDMNVWVMCL